MAADAAVTGIAGMRSAIGANEHCGAGERSKAVVELIERRGPQVGTQRRGETEARQFGKQLAIAAHRASPIAWKG
jgi:hypothetical protein